MKKTRENKMNNESLKSINSQRAITLHFLFFNIFLFFDFNSFNFALYILFCVLISI